VRGNTIIPSSILSRFSILCAILRQLHLILQIFFTLELDELKPDAFFVDQLSAGLPVLRYLWPNTRILFYCHFPDLLLAQGRTKWWKRAYRLPFDLLEEWSMSFADAISVNSGFTKGVVSKVWPSLAKKKDLEIVYPCVDIKEKKPVDEKDEGAMWQDTNIILSINRFEAKKDIGLAIRSFAGLGKHARDGVRLVVAGGYDHRVQENFLYHKELEKLAQSLGLKSATCKNVITALSVPEDVNVLFLLSVPNSLKDSLLKSARLLVYTPSNEHFGIVPLEAMLVGTPVLAANTGGPLETVVNGKTGWLCPPTEVEKWTEVIDKVLHKTSREDLQKISRAGKERVRNEFSDIKMAERIDAIVEGMANMPRQSSLGLAVVVATIAVLPAFLLLAAGVVWRVIQA
jgi:alpha-1,3/alpha-1,6-mannosyltransferase